MADDAAARRLTSEAFEAFSGGLDYPMFVVTTTNGSERSGCLVGFATQASIDPPRMLVCISARNHTYEVAQQAELVVVHALGRDQHALAAIFGAQTGDRVDKFRQCRWREGPGGVPLLEGVPRLLVGRVVGQSAFGDHVGFLLDPIHVETAAGAAAEVPLLRLGDVGDLTAGHPD